MSIKTDRQEDIDRYYNDHLKMRIIHRLDQIKTWRELMGIQSAVHNALSREEQLDKESKVQFDEWKKNNKKYLDNKHESIIKE